MNARPVDVTRVIVLDTRVEKSLPCLHLPQVISLRSTSDAVRAAACTCFAELAVGGAVLAPAASSPALLGALIDAWEAITNLLTDDSDVVCCAACAALEVLLRTARLSGGDSLVLQNLVQVLWVGRIWPPWQCMQVCCPAGP